MAAVELAKTMAIPREGDDERLKLRDTFMVILITCNGTHFRKKQTQSSCLRMLIGPHVAKHVVQIQGAL